MGRGKNSALSVDLDDVARFGFGEEVLPGETFAEQQIRLREWLDSLETNPRGSRLSENEIAVSLSSLQSRQLFEAGERLKEERGRYARILLNSIHSAPSGDGVEKAIDTMVLLSAWKLPTSDYLEMLPEKNKYEFMVHLVANRHAQKTYCGKGRGANPGYRGSFSSLPDDYKCQECWQQVRDKQLIHVAREAQERADFTALGTVESFALRDELGAHLASVLEKDMKQKNPDSFISPYSLLLRSSETFLAERATKEFLALAPEERVAQLFYAHPPLSRHQLGDPKEYKRAQEAREVCLQIGNQMLDDAKKGFPWMEEVEHAKLLGEVSRFGMVPDLPRAKVEFITHYAARQMPASAKAFYSKNLSAPRNLEASEALRLLRDNYPDVIKGA
jgi:hypothetical protein